MTVDQDLESMLKQHAHILACSYMHIGENSLVEGRSGLGVGVGHGPVVEGLVEDGLLDAVLTGYLAE